MKLKTKNKKKLNSRKEKIKKILKISSIVLAVILVISFLLFLLSYTHVKNLYTEVMAGKDNFLMAQNNLKEQNFAQTATDLSHAEENFNNSLESLNKMSWTKPVPFLGKQVKTVDHILKAGVNIASAGEEMSLLGEEIVSIVKVEGEEISYNTIGKKKKKQVLEKLHNSSSNIEVMVGKLETAISELELIPEKGLIGPLKNAVAPVKDNLPLVKNLVGKAVPVIEVLPSVLGYPEETTYLFLLQNNAELRPTGGFIGTYGILKLEAGEINIFETDNIYNLDNPARLYLSIDPPEPFVKYVNAEKWLMRDSNWSPDFPTSAKKAEEFYFLENGPEKNINGVIAVTPEFIKDLIELTGPIIVGDEEYNAENFTEKLQHKVEISFYGEGISDEDRKDVIGDIAEILKTRIFDLPKDKWASLWQVITKNTEQKQILLYLKDENVQKYVQDLDWDGRIKDIDYTGRDFVMIIDSNMAALKTDKFMIKNYDYTINKDDNEYIATLKIKYENTGIFSFMSTRYRSYTRIYVPKGSELISSEGFMTNDRLYNGVETPALVKQDDDFNKTIFEGFLSIEPKSTDEVILKYKLSQEIKDLINNKEYKLYWQKQAGTIDNGVKCTFDINEKIDSVKSLDLQSIMDDNKVQFNGDLKEDRYIEIKIK